MSEQNRCHRGPRCARRETDQANPAIKRGAQINASEGLCDACTAHLRQAIASMPQDYSDLQSAIVGIHDGLREVVGGTREPPAPISMTVAAAQAALVHEAQCWAESVADVLRVRWDTQDARNSRPSVVLERASQLLSNSLPVLLSLRDVEHVGWDADDWIVIQRDGLDGAELLLNLHNRALALTGQRRLVNHLKDPCPKCEHTALERNDGHDLTTCRACGQEYTWEEYQRFCGLVTSRLEPTA